MNNLIVFQKLNAMRAFCKGENYYNHAQKISGYRPESKRDIRRTSDGQLYRVTWRGWQKINPDGSRQMRRGN